MSDVFTGSFTISGGPSRRLPYMTNEVPSPGATGVPVNVTLAFRIKTDDLTATSIVAGSVNIQINGVPVVVAGVNVLPGQYTVSQTAGLRLIDVTIDPIGLLVDDWVYRVDGQFTDNLGHPGVDWYQFTTGDVAFAMQLDRSEPVTCPVDLSVVPMFTTDPNVTTALAGDTVTSISTDWRARGLLPYDAIELEGQDAGRWLVRDVSNGPARLFRVTHQATGLTARAYQRQEFADRNPVGLVLSPLMDFPLARAWGSLAGRYFAGNPSDANFPIAFWDAPTANYHDVLGPVPADSPGGSFDDQTNKRLDFQLIGNPGPTGARWDRYDVPLAGVIKPLLAGSVTVTPASTGVTGVGTNFSSELVPGARVTFGTDGTIYQVDSISSNTVLTLTSPWVGSVPLAGQLVHRLVAGTRVLQVLKMASMPPGTSVFLGLAGQGASPTVDGPDRMGCSFVSLENEYVEVRAHVGGTVQSNQTAWRVQEFMDRDLVVEVELIAETEAVIRVSSLDEPGAEIVAFRTQVTGGASPLMDRWTCTVVQEGPAAPGSRAIGAVRYVDVEPGLGVPYEQVGTVTSGQAKGRLAHNVTWVDLGGSAGWTTVDLQVAFTTYGPNQYDRIFWDDRPALVVIDTFTVEGGAATVLDGNQTAYKFSLHQGFDEIDLTFRADRRGRWYCLVDGRDPRTSRVLAEGPYDVANTAQQVRVFGEQMADLPDGPHEVTVVVCRDPVIENSSALVGIGSLVAPASILRVSGALLIGYGSLDAQADVVPADEELTAMIENESSQVTGVATLFTTSVPYVAGKLKVWLDGVLQNYNPPGRVTETNPALGQFTLSSAPRVGQKLVVEFVPV